MAEEINIVVPDLGDFDGVEVIEILVAVGDTVAREDGLITLETDKATMDIPAPSNGAIKTITIAVGDTVSSGHFIGTMTIEVGDTVVVAPAINADLLKGDTTVIATPESTDAGRQTIEIPDLGDFDDVDVIEVHVVVSDKVSIDDPLVTIETDKAAMEVPSTAAGTITGVLVAVGDKVSKGSAVVVMDAEAVAIAPVEATPTIASPISSPSAQSAFQSLQKPRELPAIDESGFSRAHASPSVRRLARELGVNLAEVKGSGLKNRIIHDDVKAFVKAVMSISTSVLGGALPKVPVIDFAKFGEIDTQALTRIQKISGPRLQASWINLPHVTQHDLADITGLEAKRQQLKVTAKEKGISLTPLAFILKACIAALKEFPKVNASLSENGVALIYKKYYHLGFAADTENGLMVPVIRDADRMDVYEIASALRALSASARDGKLRGAELQGASFTISSLGGIGGTAFTPIVNAPEVAILGVSRSAMQPVWNGTEFEPRLMLPISFSYDHRVIDGAYAVRFTSYLCQQLADVDSLLAATH
jgi:pyruvate dehydrogenase E2 component (dihydrolipoamide acetyltransferase)